MKLTTRLNNTLLLCMLLFSLGCGQSVETKAHSSASVAPLQTLNAQQQAQKELAISAKDRLFESLLGELTKSMGEQGPAKSIGVCKTRAPEIAMQVGKDTGVRIGRTSFNLRNESNVAPDWAARFVENKVENPIDVALPNNELGVLLPIRLKATCTLCHGSDEQVMPDVKAAIVSNYPNDTATGFSEGDIRGYFWIEVPEFRQD